MQRSVKRVVSLPEEPATERAAPRRLLRISAFTLGLFVLAILAACGQTDPDVQFTPQGSAIIVEESDHIKVEVDGGQPRTAVVSVDEIEIATLHNFETVIIQKADYPAGPHELKVFSTWDHRDRSETQSGTFQGTGAPAEEGESDEGADEEEPSEEPVEEQPSDEEPVTEEPAEEEPVEEQPTDEEPTEEPVSDGPSGGDSVVISPAGSCLDDASAVNTLDGEYRAYDNREGFPAGSAVDASNALFNSTDDTYTAFRLYNAGDVCVHGGVYDNLVDPDASWDYAKQRTSIAFRYSDRIAVENVALLRTGDGVSFGEDVRDWTIRSSYIQRTMDDAIENDYMEGGLVDDVLVDHTFAFISSRVGSSRRDESYNGGTITVQNSLVRLAPQNAADGSFKGGRLWKWEKYAKEPSKLVVKNNLFVFEAGEYRNTYLDPADDPDIDYDVILEAEGNVVVWLGDGPFPARVPDGFTVVTDRNVWENARAEWFDAHPQFAQFE